MTNAKRSLIPYIDQFYSLESIHPVTHLITAAFIIGCLLTVAAHAAPEMIGDVNHTKTSRLKERPVDREVINDKTTKARQTLKGTASWYGPGFHGRRCSNGERFNMYAMTAAHRTLPFGTRVKVTNQRTGKSTLVRITDRGPFIHGRVIDLSKGAAQAVGMISSGTAPVKLEVL